MRRAASHRALDVSLMLVVGPDDTRGRPVRDVVAAAVAGGVTAVQFRQKGGDVRAHVAEARALVALLRPLGVPLLVNDRIDVALAADADGAHVGQQDLAPGDARRLLGPGRFLGLSVTTPREAEALGRLPAGTVDYAGVGPVFATATKLDAAPPLGRDGVVAACAALAVPAVAIGAISAANAAAVLDAGVQGLAVVSAICAADDPARAARRLAELVRPVQAGVG